MNTQTQEWIKWDGGECPVDKDAWVDILLFNHDMYPSMLARIVNWRNKDHVIFYRLGFMSTECNLKQKNYRLSAKESK